MPRGKLIVIEGGEGSGKGEHVRKLTEFLKEKNLPVRNYREPGEGNFGEEIRKLVKHSSHPLSPLTETFLFEAARSDLYEKRIIPSLQKGINVITDRSGLSTLVYQGIAGGINSDFINEANYFATQNTSPDLTFVINVPPQIGLKNETVKDNRFTNKGRGYHEKVNEGYRTLALAHPDKMFLVSYLHQGIELMQEEIRKETLQRFGKDWNLN
jgi:dTMP kinase